MDATSPAGAAGWQSGATLESCWNKAVAHERFGVAATTLTADFAGDALLNDSLVTTMPDLCGDDTGACHNKHAIQH